MISNKCILLIGLIFTAIIPTSTKAQPKLTIPEPEFDFGYVPQAAKVAHYFWLYSTGTDTLRILQINPG
jgi:hypothetical protein